MLVVIKKLQGGYPLNFCQSGRPDLSRPNNQYHTCFLDHKLEPLVDFPSPSPRICSVKLFPVVLACLLSGHSGSRPRPRDALMVAKECPTS